MTTSDTASLLAAFAPHTGDAVESDDTRRMGAALLDAWDRSRELWPDSKVAPERFVRFLAERVDAQRGAEALGALCVSDLFLALACLEGERFALGELNQRVRSESARVSRRIDPSTAFVDEVAQQLLHRLLVGDPASRKLLQYQGRGPLNGWLRAAATRVALNVRRARAGEMLTAPQDLPESSLLAPLPELEVIRARYRTEFSQAFRAALTSLTSRERNVLRMRFCERMTTDQIGEFYGAHRMTVSRWVTGARQAVLEHFRSHLLTQLGLSNSELDDLTRLLRSQLDVGISSLLSHTDHGTLPKDTE